MATKSIYNWFSEYAESHQNPVNKRIHWICVPVIFFSIVCLLSTIPLGEHFSLATLAMFGATVFYVRLSPKLSLGLVLFYMACLCGAEILTWLPIPLWQSAIILFVLAWIGQFYGHKIEGKKPSFLKDLQFLLIGPAWLMGFVYQRLGIRF
jgi:uncharacterized membrane protein YGL010W